ncbi:MAG: leucine-rich repeat protein, partial [Tannerella sp.]|nr:leucine-rich repeat protein [Tannerella sp.]
MKHLILLFAMILLPVAGFAQGGTTGTLTWSITDGTLTVGGTGAMPDYYYSGGSPWWAYKNSITSVIIEDGVTTIGSTAFEGCISLTSVNIGSSVTTIGEYAFEDCSGLASVNIPYSVTTIEEGTFRGCSSLTSITVEPDNPNYTAEDGVLFNKVKTLLIQCPEGKTGTYVIPSSVTTIGGYAFTLCSNLTSVTVDAGNMYYTAEDGVLFNKAKTLLIQYPGGKTGTYAVPNSVTTIGGYAFFLCGNLTSVTIPNSVTAIRERAFDGCSSLTSVAIPNSVTTIGEEAFRDCSSLTSVTISNSVTEIGRKTFFDCSSLTSVAIPNSVTEIGDRAFDGCNSLTSVTIPNSVTEIGDIAFADCSSLEDVYVEWATPLDILDGVFYNVDVASCTLHVPAGTEALYGAADYWKDFHITGSGPVSLTVSPATLTIPATGGLESITVTSDVSWAAISSETWATVSPTSGSNNGTVTVTATANTGAARTATITIAGSGITRAVSVMQAAGTPAPSLTVSPSTLTVPATGGTESITITSNISWTAVSSETWATVSTSSGSNNG